MPAVTRSLIRADDSEHGASHRACGVDLILDADEADAEIIELLERGEQVAGGSREAVELPDQDALHLAARTLAISALSCGRPSLRPDTAMSLQSGFE
jgi:hypothetical protein